VFIASTIACSLVLTARAGVHAAAANVHSATTTAHVHTAARPKASASLVGAPKAATATLVSSARVILDEPRRNDMAPLLQRQTNPASHEISRVAS
jgi:hypothetical protein